MNTYDIFEVSYEGGIKMAYKIDKDACEMCGACKSACSVSAIKMNGVYYTVDEELCIDCESCVSACGFSAIGPA